MHKSMPSLAVTITLSLAMLSPVRTLFAEDQGLEGSWNVLVTPNALFLCNGRQIGPPLAPFHELASYAAGGVMVETNTQLNANSASLAPGFPFNASDGHGSWKGSDPYFVSKFRKYLYDANGHYVANADLAEKISLEDNDANSFTGTFTIRLSFLNSSPAVCSSGNLKARRIRVP
jgi:hypothetical protein